MKDSPNPPSVRSILISENAIRKRVKKLGMEISALYGEEEITIISIINGAILFTADLMRHIRNPTRLDCIRISSYRSKTKSLSEPKILSRFSLDITKRHVLIIDDILDTGKTLSLLMARIKKLQPASIRTCVLLDKKARREVEFEADFVGYQISDQFVVGYGMDFAENYRNLPYIAVLEITCP